MQNVKGSKFIVWFLALCVISAIGFVVYIKRAYDTRPQLNIGDVSNRRYNPNIYSLKQKIIKPVDTKVDLTEEGKKLQGTDEKCLASMSEMLKIPFGENVPQFVEALKADPCYQNPEFLKGKIDKEKALEACRDVTNPMCEVAVVFYKAAILDALTKETQLHDLTEQQLLAKFLAQYSPFQTEAPSPEKFKDMKAIATEMMKRNPDDVNYQDAFLQSEMLPFLSSEQKTDFSPEFDQLLQKGLTERPYDEKLQEYLLVRDMKSSLDERQARAEKILNENPDSSIAAYYLSWFNYKRGDHVSAQKFLEKAILLDPSNDRYKETLAKLKVEPRPNPEKDQIYQVTLTWGTSF